MIGISLGAGYSHHSVSVTGSLRLSVSLKALIKSTDSREAVGSVERANEENSAGVKMRTVC